MKSIRHATDRRVGPGDLTEVLTIEEETRTSDGHRGFTKSWATFATVKATASPLFVDEREHQGALRNVTRYRFTIWRNDAITERMRIVWDDRTYNILGFRKSGKREAFMDIIAESGLGT